MTRKAATTTRGPRTREVIALVEEFPGLTPYRIAHNLCGGTPTRGAFGAVSRAVRGGWVEKHGGRLYPRGTAELQAAAAVSERSETREEGSSERERF